MKSASWILSLFLGGCGVLQGTDTLDPPIKPSCDALDEVQCTNHPACEPIYREADSFRVPCDCIPEQPNCHCGAPAPVFDGCQPVQDPPACQEMDEAACVASPDCQPIYQTTSCGGLAPPCDEPDCGDYMREPCEPVSAFAGCEELCEQPICPMYCEWGYAPDLGGCDCACNPPPQDLCEGLDEYTCMSALGCQPIYGSGMRCEGGGCDGNDEGGAPRRAPMRCVSIESCPTLDEQACTSSPYCEPVYDNCYGGGDCPAPGCDPCEPAYSTCHPIIG